MKQYDKAAVARQAAEANEDFMTINSDPLMMLSHPVEVQDGKFYTRTIFDLFQKELKDCVPLVLNEEKGHFLFLKLVNFLKITINGSSSV